MSPQKEQEHIEKVKDKNEEVLETVEKPIIEEPVIEDEPIVEEITETVEEETIVEDKEPEIEDDFLPKESKASFFNSKKNIFK